MSKYTLARCSGKRGSKILDDHPRSSPAALDKQEGFHVRRVGSVILFCTSVRLYQLLSLCVICINRTFKNISPTSQLRIQQQTTVFDRRRFLITRWRLFPLKTTCIWRAVNRNHSDAHILLRLCLIPVETICRYPQSFRSYLVTIWRGLKPVVKSLPPCTALAVADVGLDSKSCPGNP